MQSEEFDAEWTLQKEINIRIASYMSYLSPFEKFSCIRHYVHAHDTKYPNNHFFHVRHIRHSMIMQNALEGMKEGTKTIFSFIKLCY